MPAMRFGLGIENDCGEDQYFWLVNGKYAHAFGEDEGAGGIFYDVRKTRLY